MGALATVELQNRLERSFPLGLDFPPPFSGDGCQLGFRSRTHSSSWLGRGGGPVSALDFRPSGPGGSGNSGTDGGTHRSFLGRSSEGRGGCRRAQHTDQVVLKRVNPFFYIGGPPKLLRR